MKKRGGRFLLILGAGLAVMAFAVVYVLTSKTVSQSQTAAVPTPLPMVSIAVAKDDVPAYAVLDASNVAMLDVDASTAVSPTVRDAVGVYNKMTLLPLAKGQPILANQLTTSGFSNVIDKGKRAFTLAVPQRSTFGGALTENDYVDVLWTQKFEVIQLVPGPDGKNEEKIKELASTKTVLENIQVLRVVDLHPAAAPSNGNGGSGNSQNSQADNASSTKRTSTTAAVNTAYTSDALPAAVLLLAVTTQQAEVLKYAQENGIIDLALRSSGAQKGPDSKTLKGPDGKDIIGDHDPEKTTGITSKVLVEQYGLLLPEILIK